MQSCRNIMTLSLSSYPKFSKSSIISFASISEVSNVSTFRQLFNQASLCPRPSAAHLFLYRSSLICAFSIDQYTFNVLKVLSVLKVPLHYSSPQPLCCDSDLLRKDSRTRYFWIWASVRSFDDRALFASLFEITSYVWSVNPVMLSTRMECIGKDM